MVVLRGHGDEGSLYDSEGTRIPLTFLHDMVSYAQDPRFEAIPRIFIVDACRGSKGGKGVGADDEKQAQGSKATGKVWQKKTGHSQRNNLVSLYGNVSGFVTWATKNEGLLSAAVIEVLKQNARKKRPLAYLATDIRKDLTKRIQGQISVLDGDPSLNPLWIRPNHKLFPQSMFVVPSHSVK